MLTYVYMEGQKQQLSLNSVHLSFSFRQIAVEIWGEKTPGRSKSPTNQSSRETLLLNGALKTPVSLWVVHLGAACEWIIINRTFQTGDGNRTEALDLHGLTNRESKCIGHMWCKLKGHWLFSRTLVENDHSWLPPHKSHRLVIKRPKITWLQSSLKLDGYWRNVATQRAVETDY